MHIRLLSLDWVFPQSPNQRPVTSVSYTHLNRWTPLIRRLPCAPNHDVRANADMPCNKEGPLMPTQKLLERKALIGGIVINVLQVLAGVAVFFMTGLKAMFLDFSFTAISVLSGMVAVYLSSRTVRTTERFPNGM